jgi:hypothetical protein
VAFVVGVLVAATSVAIFAITDFLMMSSSATSAFRGGGAIRTDITVTTRTITMDTATMGTAGTGTTVAPGTVTTMAPVMDTAMAAEPVMDTAMAAEPGVCGGGDKRAPRAFRIRLVARASISKEGTSINSYVAPRNPTDAQSQRGRTEAALV